MDTMKNETLARSFILTHVVSADGPLRGVDATFGALLGDGRSY